MKAYKQKVVLTKEHVAEMETRASTVMMITDGQYDEPSSIVRILAYDVMKLLDRVRQLENELPQSKKKKK